jgi:hypothetical protein
MDNTPCLKRCFAVNLSDKYVATLNDTSLLRVEYATYIAARTILVKTHI